jgi:FtsX extracellular domain
MKVVAVGTACFLAGLAIGAAATVVVGDTQLAAPASLPDDESGADDQVVDRGGHVLVFLVEGVSDAERRGIEVVLDAQEDVEDYEYWNAEASRAEARRLFRDDAEMLAKIEAGVHVPESYRLLLRDPSRPNATVVSSHLDGLPGVLEVTITDAVPDLGE